MSEQDERDEQIWGEQPPRDGIEQYAREADPFYSGAAASAGADPERPRQACQFSLPSGERCQWPWPEDHDRVVAKDGLPPHEYSPSRAQGGPSLDDRDIERLQRIQDLQPNAVGYMRRYGFVMDVTGPLADDASDLDRWKILAFSLYTDLVEASTLAEHILEVEYAARFGVAPEPSEVGET